MHTDLSTLLALASIAGVSLLGAPLGAQSPQALYDFEILNGSDTYPYTLLDGQDNWTEQTFNSTNRCGVTATLSYNGTKSLQYEEVGPGFGCDASRINDARWSFPTFTGAETNAHFEADVRVGFWGGSFGLAFDVDGDGLIRGSQAGERGVRFVVGTNNNVQLRLVAADQTVTQMPLATASGSVSGGHWVRIRVVMDLAAAGGTGLGSLHMRNLTTGESTFTAVPGLQSIPLALNTSAADATNPTLWNSVWLHFEGATYGLDNIRVGLSDSFPPILVAVSEPTPGAGTLTAANGTMQGLDTLRWNYNDFAGSSTGQLVWLTFNYGAGGSPPVGATAIVPGLIQTWAGSNPMGFVDIAGPDVVGGADSSLSVPAGIFSTGDTVRLQGFVLDTRLGGPLPLQATNAIEFVW